MGEHVRHKFKYAFAVHLYLNNFRKPAQLMRNGVKGIQRKKLKRDSGGGANARWDITALDLN